MSSLRSTEGGRARRRRGRLASTGLAALVVTAALVRPGNVPLELRTGGASGTTPHPAPSSAGR